MTNLAKFEIVGSISGASPSSDAGFDAVAGETLTIRLEGTGQLVSSFQLQSYDPDNKKHSPRASEGAPLLTLVGSTSGRSAMAATPSSDITIAIPDEGANSWILRSVVSGGTVDGAPNPDLYFERMIAVRSADGLRKIVANETTQYSPGSWSGAFNDFVDGMTSGPNIGYTVPFRAIEHPPEQIANAEVSTRTFRLTPNREHTVTCLVQIQGASYYGKEVRRCSVLTDADSVVSVSALSSPIYAYENGEEEEFIAGATWAVSGTVISGVPHLQVAVTNAIGAPGVVSVLGAVEHYLPPGAPV